MSSPRSGRRPGDSGTRESILVAARELFGDRGFAGTTMRAVAAAAGVDVALVSHYFGNKDGLFAAALEVPIDVVAAGVLAELSPDGFDRLGEALVRGYLRLWGAPETAAQMRAVLRCAASRPEARDVLRRGVTRALAASVPADLIPEPRELRTNLVAAQLVGMGFMRSIIGLPGLEHASEEALVASVGPTIQRYLMGDLGLTPSA